MQKTVIYLLRDPRNGDVRYVGKTAQSLAERLMKHLSDKRKNPHKQAWLNQLRSEGLVPIIEPIVSADEKSWAALERWWIRLYNSIAPGLVNVTDGGDTGYVYTEESRRRISEGLRGKGHGERWRSDHSRRMTGRKIHTEERKREMSRRMTGNTHAKRHDYIVTTPEGVEIAVDNLSQFCIEHGLDQVRMRTLASGDPLRKRHKGWLCRWADPPQKI